MCGRKRPVTRSPGVRVQLWTGGLEHAEYNRADESECNIRGYNAKSADERTYEIHWGRLPGFTSCAHITLKASKAFPAQKVSVAVHPPFLHRRQPRKHGEKFVKSIC